MIKTTFDILCDGKGCDNPPFLDNWFTSKAVVRRHAKTEGWAHRRVSNRMVDLCPLCVDKAAAGTSEIEP